MFPFQEIGKQDETQSVDETVIRIVTALLQKHRHAAQQTEKCLMHRRFLYRKIYTENIEQQIGESSQIKGPQEVHLESPSDQDADCLREEIDKI